MKKVLLVDDEIDVQVWIADFLRNHGLHIEACANGVQASKKLADEKYDLIITDLRMPEEDGLSVMYKAREVLPHNRRTPIIIISGALKHEDARLVMAGLEKMDLKILHKPFEPEALLEAVCDAFGIGIEDVETLLE